MPGKETAPPQEPFDFRHSYVRDGVMRAYANRFAVLAFVSGVIALLSLGFAIYVRLQPPTIIRITPDGAITEFSIPGGGVPLGIAAGPLLNGRYVKAALDKGFDLPVYKTVRTRRYPAHAWPNVLAVHPHGNLPLDTAPLVGDENYTEPLEHLRMGALG